LFSASKVLALIAGVNGIIAGTLILKEAGDAATNTPDLDVAPAGAIQQGWTCCSYSCWYPFTEDVEAGDFNYLETKCAY
jgi:hypothetical protein